LPPLAKNQKPKSKIISKCPKAYCEFQNQQKVNMIHNSTQSDLRQKVRNLKTIKKKKQRNVENEEK